MTSNDIGRFCKSYSFEFLAMSDKCVQSGFRDEHCVAARTRYRDVRRYKVMNY